LIYQEDKIFSILADGNKIDIIDMNVLGCRYYLLHITNTTSLTPTHICAYAKLRHGISTSYVMGFSIFNELS